MPCAQARDWIPSGVSDPKVPLFQNKTFGFPPSLDFASVTTTNELLPRRNIKLRLEETKDGVTPARVRRNEEQLEHVPNLPGDLL
ncbi:hypothetical protein HPB47_000650 [Ixodes persulcatus]|uniref:Uncharacterized protein n=1 Tax=Ixodes persulcatus TaxID=34615 RepID=A0AC60PRX6_IXOPE|nr:hypothetical protein HPB47_000650 [Ixodes persulcatus]